MAIDEASALERAVHVRGGGAERTRRIGALRTSSPDLAKQVEP
jgi:hypothetical protein